MKKKFLTAIPIILATAITVTGVFFGVREVKMNKYKKSRPELPKGFTVTAHTGCMGTDENSLDSIKKGAENGVQVVEFDLYFDKNGNPVLAHDEPVGGEISLDEAFALLSKYENLKANVDVKTLDNLEKVYPLAKKNGVEERIFYTGIGEDDIKTVEEKSPEVSYYLNVDVDKSKNTDKEYLQSLVEKVQNSGAVGINFNYKSASKELVETFHENDLLVSIWTVDDEYNMYKILSLAPDNITSRNPDKVLEKLK